MEQFLADRRDGEELIDTKVGIVHSTGSRLQSSQLFPYCVIWPYPVDYAVKFSILNSWMHTHGTMFIRQR